MSCQTGFTLAKVKVTSAAGTSDIYDCLDNSATAATAETIPFCIYYKLDQTAAALAAGGADIRYYC